MANILFKKPVSGALYMFERGCKVFPIKPGDSKEPALRGWQEWAQSANSKKVNDYGTANSFHNWGVFTEYLIVIDVDNKKGRKGSENFKKLIEDKGKLEKTFVVRTPTGGFHYYFRGSCRNSVGKIAEHVDVRGIGGYVVAPGSRIEERQYEISTDAPIADIPTWLINHINEKTRKEPLVLDEKSSAPDGTRDDTMTKIAGAMRRHGLEYESILAVLEIQNDKLCVPPLEQHDLERIANSISKYAPETAKAVEDFSSVEESDSRAMRESELIGKAPQREWLIEDWLPAGEISSLYGKGGTGKSLLALQLARAVAGDGSFLGLEIKRHMPVIAIFCEDSKDEVHRRIESIKNTPEAEFAEKKDIPFYFWPRVGLQNDIARMNTHGNDIVEGPFKAQLEEQLRSMSRGPKLLILDTLSDVYLGDENVREKVNKFIKTHVGGLVKKYELTVLLIAHPSRTGQNTRDMLSGSTAWENSVRNRWAMLPHKDFEEVYVLKRMKSNYAKSGEELMIEWDHGCFRIADIATIAEQAMTAEQKDILEGVSRHMGSSARKALNPVAHDLIADRAMSHLFAGISPSTVERQVQKTLQYPRGAHGYMYWYEEQEIKGIRGTRWVCRRPETEEEKERETTAPVEREEISFSVSNEDLKLASLLE